MAEEPTKKPDTQPEQDPAPGADATAYIEQIKKLREHTVDKTEYDKLKAERDELIRTVAEGGTFPEEDGDTAAEAKARQDRIKELRNELFKSDSSTSNLTFIKNAVELRDLILTESNGKDDIFVAKNKLHTPSGESYEAAQRVADVYKQCIEAAKGDSEMFTAVLQSRMNDVSLPPVNNKINRR